MYRNFVNSVTKVQLSERKKTSLISKIKTLLNLMTFYQNCNLWPKHRQFQIKVSLSLSQQTKYCFYFFAWIFVRIDNLYKCTICMPWGWEVNNVCVCECVFVGFFFFFFFFFFFCVSLSICCDSSLVLAAIFFFFIIYLLYLK